MQCTLHVLSYIILVVGKVGTEVETYGKGVVEVGIVQYVLNIVVKQRRLHTGHLDVLSFFLIVSRIAYAELVVLGKVKVGRDAIVVNGAAVATYHHMRADVMLFAVGECVDTGLVGRMR